MPPILLDTPAIVIQYISMGMFPVSTAKEKELREKMDALNIREEDIEESFVRSQGRGGRNVNKVSTCVQRAA